MALQTMTQVVASPLAVLTGVALPVLQRKCACGQHSASGECEKCKKNKSEEKSSRDPLLQRSAVNSNTVNQVPPIVHEVFCSPGKPLDTATRAYFEPLFGHDFSHVRVHTDSRAIESARLVNALAYTVGQGIVSQDTRLSSSASAGRSLLGHELTHVVQQRGAAQPTNDLRIGAPDDATEREANQRAESFAKEGIAGPVSRESTPILRRLSPSALLAKGTPCPTSMHVGRVLQIPHNRATTSNRNAFRTYFLGTSRMEVGPGPDHSGHCMQEKLRFVSSTCPRSVTDAVTPCTKSDCLPINSKSGGMYPTGSINDDATSFLDEHKTHSARSLLEGTQVTSCQTICDQVYTCDTPFGPQVGGTFRITRNFQADNETLPNGTTVHVTTGTVDKTEVASPPATQNPVPKLPAGQPLPPPRSLPEGTEQA